MTHKIKNENRYFSYDLKKKKFLLNLQVNISLVVNDNEAEECVRALHAEFFECSSQNEKSVDNLLNGCVEDLMVAWQIGQAS